LIKYVHFVQGKKIMLTKYHAILAGLVLALCAQPAFSDEAEEKEKKPSPKLANGLISLTRVEPAITPVWDYSGDLSTRSTMFGDFNGGRASLYEQGVTFDGWLTQVLQGVTSGGNREDNGGAQYNGMAEYHMTLDTAKLGWWSGAMINFTGQTSYGSPISSEAGNISPVNMTPMWPVPFENSTELMEYYVMQALPNKMVLLVGRLDATNFLDKNSFANNPETQFLQTNLNNELLWGEFLSFSTYAALLLHPVNKTLTIGYAVWDPETTPGDYGGVWDHYGAAVTFIFDYKTSGGKKGVFNPVIAYTNKDALALDNPRFVPGIIEGDVPKKKGNWMLAIVGEQYLWTPDGAHVSKADGGRKEDFDVGTAFFGVNQPGVGLFYRIAFTPDSRNLWNIGVSGGIGARGVINGRPHDRMGIGMYWMKASSDLNKQPIIGGILNSETGFNAFYNFAIAPWLQLSADLQYISTGLETADNSWVLGTRLFVQF
jgi:porin